MVDLIKLYKYIFSTFFFKIFKRNVFCLGILFIIAVLLTGCAQSVNGSGEPNGGFSSLFTPIPDSTEAPNQISVPTQTSADSFSEIVPTQTPFEATSTPFINYFSNPYPLSTVEYVIPLSIRHLTDRQAVLFFELSEARNGLLIYKTLDGDAPQQVEIYFTTEERRHLIMLENLLPGQGYQAAVFVLNDLGELEKPAFSGSDWGSVAFSTASGQEPLRVGVLGDASFGDQATSDLILRMATYPLDFVLHTGDVVDVTEQDADPYQSYIQKFFTPFAPLLHKIPVYTVMGNHDYDRDIQLEGQPYYDYAFPAFGGLIESTSTSPGRNQYYKFGYNNIQFLMLDSQVFFGVEGREAQEQWLEQRLADPNYRCTIPIFHVSPFSSSVVHPQDGLPVRYTWAPKFAAAKVPVVFSGHYHHYERSLESGVTYIVSGGGSSILYARGETLPQSQLYIPKTHFIMMEIFSDRIQLTAIGLDGGAIDQVSIPLP